MRLQLKQKQVNLRIRIFTVSGAQEAARRNGVFEVRVRETDDWDLFLGPLEWARAETGRADRGELQRPGR